MNVLRAITVKPWLPTAAPAPMDEPRMPAARIGLLWLLAMITLLFSLLAFAFVIRAQLPDWQTLSGAGRPLASLAPLWVNTALLAAGSLALGAASLRARVRGAANARAPLMLGGLFAIAFLIGQGVVWQQFIANGHFVASNPSASFFYLLTGLHGAHLVGGLLALAGVAARVLSGAPEHELLLGIKLCALYWHFLLAVWLLVFALLSSPQDTLVWFAQICGLR